jgi:hypothetical protein
MTDYLIKPLGSTFVIAADGQDVLRCADENIARQIVSDAETGRFRAHSCTSLVGDPAADRDILL